MKRTFLLTATVFIILASRSFALDDNATTRNRTYSVTMYLVSLNEEILLETDNEFLSQDLGSSFGTGNIRKMRFGQHLFEIDDKGRLLWDSQPISTGELPFQGIAAPPIQLLDGTTAKLQERNPVEYFMQKPDGSYGLKTTLPEESPGISLDISVQSLTRDQVKVACSVVVIYMKDRQKLSWTNLDVGKPILKESGVDVLQKKVNINHWWIASMLGAKDGAVVKKEALMILMRINHL